jgi:hypothetical protein
VTQGVAKWYDTVVVSIVDDIKELENVNIELLDESIDGFRESIYAMSEGNADEESLDELLTLCDSIKKEIGIN